MAQRLRQLVTVAFSPFLMPVPQPARSNPMDRHQGHTRALWSSSARRAVLSFVVPGAFACGDGADPSAPESDPCGNAIGNGSQVIAGPSTPGGSDADRSFNSLVVSPADANLIFLGTERNGIVRSRDGGRTWERLRQGLRHAGGGYPEVYDLALASGDPSVLVAATRDSPGPLTGEHPSTIGGVYRSTDGGATWARANCGLPQSATTAIQLTSADGRSMVVAISAGAATFSPLTGTLFPGGLYRSTDGGAQWVAAQSSVSLTTSQFAQVRRVASTGELFTYAFDRTNRAQSVGFLRSTDGGATWSALANPLAGRIIAQFDLSPDGRTIWANSDDGFRIWRSTDGGVTWAETGGFFANGAVAASPHAPAVLLLDDFGTLRYSADGLATAQVAASSSQPFEDLAFAPSDPTVAYAVSRGYDVYRSANGGRTFALVSNLRTAALR